MTDKTKSTATLPDDIDPRIRGLWPALTPETRRMLLGSILLGSPMTYDEVAAINASMQGMVQENAYQDFVASQIDKQTRHAMDAAAGGKATQENRRADAKFRLDMLSEFHVAHPIKLDDYENKSVAYAAITDAFRDWLEDMKSERPDWAEVIDRIIVKTHGKSFASTLRGDFKELGI